MKRKNLLLFFISIAAITILVISSCIIVADEELLKNLIRSSGLTGSWDVIKSSGVNPNTLTIYNDSSSDVTSFKTGVTLTVDEPDWSDSGEVTEHVTSDFFKIVSGDDNTYTIGTGGEDINAAVVNSRYIWVKIIIASGKYLVGSFYFETDDEWSLIIEDEE